MNRNANEELAMKRIVTIGMLVVVLAGGGCSSGSGKPSPKGDADLKEKLLLSEAPAGAKSVLDTLKNAKNGDAVTVEARIGGNGKPFVKGQGAFRIVDMSKIPCEDDDCGNPWCELDKSELPKCTAFVQLVDETGSSVAADAEEKLGLKLCQVVVLTGKARRDKDGALTIEASGVYVKE
jgi:hypothetical protein